MYTCFRNQRIIAYLLPLNISTIVQTGTATRFPPNLFIFDCSLPLPVISFLLPSPFFSLLPTHNFASHLAPKSPPSHAHTHTRKPSDSLCFLDWLGRIFQAEQVANLVN